MAVSAAVLCYDAAVMRLIGIMVLALVLAGCEGTSLRGSASEHGVRNVSVGIPL
jgi:hypothetical protein